jgi:hypothetical protein
MVENACSLLWVALQGLSKSSKSERFVLIRWHTQSDAGQNLRKVVLACPSCDVTYSDIDALSNVAGLCVAFLFKALEAEFGLLTHV